MKAVLVIGLPASGKTTFAKRCVAQFLSLGVSAMLLDDPQSRAVFDRGVQQAVAQSIQVLFITDPMLCQVGVRDMATKVLEDLGHDVTVVQFANDPKACLRNARQRHEKPVAGLIENLTQGYQIITSFPVFPVYPD